MIPQKKHKKSTSYVLCKLDSKYSLFASKCSFIIKERIKQKDEESEDAWIGKYFYSDLDDAIRGYLRHKLRSKSVSKKVNGDLNKLLEVIEELNKSMHDLFSNFEKEMVDKLRDPVEHHMLQAALEVKSNG